MRVEILFTVKYKGEYLVPGTETDMNKKEAGQAIDAGAAVEIPAVRKETKTEKTAREKAEKEDAAKADADKKGGDAESETIEKAKALGIDTEGKTLEEVEAEITELTGEGK